MSCWCIFSLFYPIFFTLSYRHQKEAPIPWQRRQQQSSPRPAAYRRRAPSTTNWAACPACPSCPAGSQTLAPSPRHSRTRFSPKGDKYCPSPENTLWRDIKTTLPRSALWGYNLKWTTQNIQQIKNHWVKILPLEMFSLGY